MTNTTHLSRQDLEKYLQNKYISPSSHSKEIKAHIDSCFSCWKIWNNVRWEEAKEKSGLKDLKEYLGDKFIDHFDSSWALVDEWKRLDPKSEEDIKSFYKSTENYLYNLIIWNDSGDRYLFQEDFNLLKDVYKVKSIIDFGCGVGNDTLSMLENNFEVFPLDFKCPSADFLDWRLKKRGYPIRVIDVEKISEYPDADMFWAVDVLEHMVNPEEIAHKLSDKTRVFGHVSNFDVSGGRHPFHINSNIHELEDQLRKRGFKEKKAKFLSLWVKE